MKLHPCKSSQYATISVHFIPYQLKLFYFLLIKTFKLSQIKTKHTEIIGPELLPLTSLLYLHKWEILFHFMRNGTKNRGNKFKYN